MSLSSPDTFPESLSVVSMAPEGAVRSLTPKLSLSSRRWVVALACGIVGAQTPGISAPGHEGSLSERVAFDVVAEHDTVVSNGPGHKVAPKFASSSTTVALSCKMRDEPHEMYVGGAGSGEVVVKYNQTLCDISRQSGVSVASLRRFNAIGDSNSIVPGQIIRIPIVTQQPQADRSTAGGPTTALNNQGPPTTVPARPVLPAVKVEAEGCESTQCVTLESGQTLYDLAQKYDTTVSEILRLNPALTKDNMDRLLAGSTLIVSNNRPETPTTTLVVESSPVPDTTIAPSPTAVTEENEYPELETIVDTTLPEADNTDVVPSTIPVAEQKAPLIPDATNVPIVINIIPGDVPPLPVPLPAPVPPPTESIVAHAAMVTKREDEIDDADMALLEDMKRRHPDMPPFENIVASLQGEVRNDSASGIRTFAGSPDLNIVERDSAQGWDNPVLIDRYQVAAGIIQDQIVAQNYASGSNITPIELGNLIDVVRRSNTRPETTLGYPSPGQYRQFPLAEQITRNFVFGGTTSAAERFGSSLTIAAGLAWLDFVDLQDDRRANNSVAEIRILDITSAHHIEHKHGDDIDLGVPRSWPRDLKLSGLVFLASLLDEQGEPAVKYVIYGDKSIVEDANELIKDAGFTMRVIYKADHPTHFHVSTADKSDEGRTRMLPEARPLAKTDGDTIGTTPPQLDTPPQYQKPTLVLNPAQRLVREQPPQDSAWMDVKEFFGDAFRDGQKLVKSWFGDQPGDVEETWQRLFGSPRTVEPTATLRSDERPWRQPLAPESLIELRNSMSDKDYYAMLNTCEDTYYQSPDELYQRITANAREMGVELTDDDVYNLITIAELEGAGCDLAIGDVYQNAPNPASFTTFQFYFPDWKQHKAEVVELLNSRDYAVRKAIEMYVARGLDPWNAAKRPEFAATKREFVQYFSEHKD